MSMLAPPAEQGMGGRLAATLQRAGLEVELVRCLEDNYCPIIHQASSGTTLVVDTPEAGPILTALQKRGWSPTHVLNTHHHYDHVGGNLELKGAFPSLKILGPYDRSFVYPGPYPPPGEEQEQIPGVDVRVREGDEVQCGGMKAQVLEVGGHTDGHIAFYFPDVPLAFTGDSLFTLGCGRVFTGDFPRMQVSLQKLRVLPDETVVYSGHEYTASNAKFALQVEPDNVALQERVALVEALRQAGEPTVPTLLAHEKATNPFLRWDVATVQAAVGKAEASASDVFTAMRRWKDTGKRPADAAAASSRL